MTVTINGSTGIARPLGSAGSPSDVNTSDATTGLYFPASNTVGISTAGTNALYIDASQNVGIGTASVTNARFAAKGADTGTSNFSILATNSAGSSLFGARNDGAIFTGLTTNSPYNLTLGIAANAVLYSDGYLYRSTSSLRYKQNIQDYSKGLIDLAKLRPVTFNSKPVEGRDLDTHTYAGFIAEEVHDAGLTEFVQYNAEGEPDALSYANMVALLTKAILELKTTVDAQATEIAALKAKVGA